MIKNGSSFVLPTDAVKYVLFQRTPYLFFRSNKGAQRLKSALPKRAGYALEALFSYNYLPVAIEALFRRRSVSRLFQDELEREYAEMKPWLPLSARQILDIGSGIGGIDLYLARHFESEKPVIHLLDRTEMPSKVFYGFKGKACYYNSLAESKNFLVANGVAPEQVILHEVPKEGKPVFPHNLDLIISLISWGFHYPVETYLNEAYEALAPGGILIMDIRKTIPGVDGAGALRTRFGAAQVQTISETSGVVRVAARKLYF